MFIVTNRTVDETKHTPSGAFGKKPMEGPNELRLAEASKQRGNWKVKVLPDTITPAMAEEVSLPPGNHFASEYAAKKLLQRIHSTSGGGKNLLLFVHGFNNDITAALNRADELERNYNLEVIVFSWPANGGGVTGVPSYKSDKRDALASTGALSRTLQRMHELLRQAHKDYVKDLESRADDQFGENSESWDRYFTRHVEKRCPFTINLLLHSMGNYLYKHLLKSSTYSGNLLLFDNVVMAAADTNSEGHAEWVNRIPYRSRLYITINENDSALKASRLKMGENQKARLGHFPYGLDSIATYVDFTGQPHVGNSHAYFEGSTLKNAHIKRFFKAALNGQTAESSLRYDASTNLHSF